MPFTFSQEVITQIFHLARLGSESTEKVLKIQDDLNKIVQMVSTIAQADTEGVEVMAHPLDMPQPVRMDEVTESDERDKLLKLASKTEAGLFLVPPVIE